MKKILIPTDFSSVAYNATNYAIGIAEKFGSELFLYHVYSFNRRVDYNWDFPEDEQPYVKQIESRMNFKKGKFLEKTNGTGLIIHTRVEQDSIFPLFTRKVEEYNISLIILGSKGASGLTKVIFGSVAATALEMAKVPVLVVPDNYSGFTLKQIVLAVDSDEVTAGILSPLRKLALKFNAKVTILYVNSGTSKEAAEKNHLYLKDLDVNYVELPLSKNISESINYFVEKSKFDLLCMIRRKKDFFESLFKRSITKTQVYKNTIPLLVLPEIPST